MGTGSVDDGYGGGDSCCPRCQSPCSAWTLEKGTGTEPTAFFRGLAFAGARSQSPSSQAPSRRRFSRFGIYRGSEPVPFFHCTFTVRITE